MTNTSPNLRFRFLTMFNSSECLIILTTSSYTANLRLPTILFHTLKHPVHLSLPSPLLQIDQNQQEDAGTLVLFPHPSLKVLVFPISPPEVGNEPNQPGNFSAKEQLPEKKTQTFTTKTQIKDLIWDAPVVSKLIPNDELYSMCM